MQSNAACAVHGGPHISKLSACGKCSAFPWTHSVHGYPFPKQALVFTCLQYMPFENTVGKGEIAWPN